MPKPEQRRRPALRARRAGTLRPDRVTQYQARFKHCAEVKMQAFDRLPREVRAVIASAPFDVLDCSPLLVACDRLRYAGFTAGQIALCLELELIQTQNAALAAVNNDHRRRYGADLPHIAAGATLLRASATP